MNKLQELLQELNSKLVKAEETAKKASFEVKTIQAQIKKVEKLIGQFND